MEEYVLDKYVVKASQTVRQAMETITANRREVVLVENDQGQVIGVVTDGDIRRGLLRGFTLDSLVSEISTRNYIAVEPEEDRATILDMMKNLEIRHIPVVDHEKRLLGIHFLQDLIGKAVKPNIAVIMAGGKGTRLLPLTKDCPKPMIKVAGRPILERLIHHLVGYGIKKIYITINYLGEMIENYFGDGAVFGCSIEYIKETEALGTGGSLSLLPEQPQDPFIVMNGDLVTQVNVARLLEFHQHLRAKATVAGRTYQVELPYGVIENDQAQLVRLQEKPLIHYLINAGIYVFEPEVISLVPKEQFFPIVNLLNVLLTRKDLVGVYILDEDWIDIGRQTELQRANGIFQ